MLGVELTVCSWPRNADIAKGLKLSTKGTKSSLFCGWNCWPQVPPASLQGLPLPTGYKKELVGEEEVASCRSDVLTRSSLLSYPCLNVCVYVSRGGKADSEICIPFLNPREGVPKEILHFELRNFFSESWQWPGMLRKGREKKDTLKGRNTRKAQSLFYLACQNHVLFHFSGEGAFLCILKDLSWNLVHSVLIFSFHLWLEYCFFLLTVTIFS